MIIACRDRIVRKAVGVLAAAVGTLGVLLAGLLGTAAVRPAREGSGDTPPRSGGADNMIEAVIFDYGNVLVHTRDQTPRAVWARQLGLATDALQGIVHNDSSWIAAQCGQITPAAHWQAVGTTLGLSGTETAALRAAFYRGDRLHVAVVERLDRLRAEGRRVALLSNFSTELRGLLAAHDLLHRFDHIVISADIGVMKPDAAAYQAVLDRLALAPGACVFVDDQPVNVEAARALGLHGIVFRDPASCLAVLDRLLAGVWPGHGGL